VHGQCPAGELKQALVIGKQAPGLKLVQNGAGRKETVQISGGKVAI
jgi:hypothetical protein